MRSGLYCALILALLLAACATQPESTAAPQPVAPTTGPTISAEETAEQTEAAPVIDITVPPPGTLVPAVTEDPLGDMPFDRIVYEQTGGLTGVPLTIEVFGDGRVVRDGVTSTISPQQVTALTQTIQTLNFFGLQGQFTVPGASEETYLFKVTVERGGGSRTINAQDGYTPDELMQFFNDISALGLETPAAS